MGLAEEKSSTIVPMLAGGENGHGQVEEGKKIPQILVTLAICLLGMAGGAIMAWPSSALPELQNLNATLVLTQAEGSWVVGLLALGAIPGAFLAGFIAEHIGRRLTALLLAGPILMHWLMIFWSKSVWLFYIARFLAGLSVGGTGVVAPMYVSEIAGKERRATLGAVYPLSLSLGMLVSLATSALLNYRFLSVALAGLTILFLVCFYFAPESPVYRVIKGDLASARKSLTFFHGSAKSERVLQETMKIVASTRGVEKLKFGQLMHDRAFLRGLVVALGVMAELQMSGIGVVTAYSEKIFKDSGSSVDPKLASNIIFGVQVVSGCLQFLVVNRFPRKFLLLQNCICTFLCLGLLGLQSIYHWEAGWLPVLLLTIYSISFMWGLGALSFTMLGEVFSSNAKESAFSASIVLMWSLNFANTKAFPLCVSSMGIGWTLMIFAGFMALSCFHIVFLVPETRGKTLKEIQDELYGKK